MNGMNGSTSADQDATARDRNLAWELYDYRPDHPRIPELAQSVLAREPEMTGMIILTALHREACGEVEEARRLLRELMGRRDRQFLNAAKKLRDLEFSDRDYAEALRLADLVLRESPEADWLDLMEYASALVFVASPEEGLRRIDDAVEVCARDAPDEYAHALGQRALRFLTQGASPERFIPAAQEAIEADPTESLLATALAFAYLYDYRPYEAEELLKRVLREDPTDSPAQGAMAMARAFVRPLEQGTGTIDDLRRAGMGEVAWRMLRDQMFGTGLEEALGALDAVMPEDLAASLRPPLTEAEARDTGGEWKVLAWHDGQEPGTGALWGAGDAFRLMSGAEVDEMDEAIEREPEAWPRWDTENEYCRQIFTDDAGAYLVEGTGGRLYRRGIDGPDEEVAPSLADWLWDRVSDFGGRDPRPGRR